jgi:hypothetical protein
MGRELGSFPALGVLSWGVPRDGTIAGWMQGGGMCLC